jgi:membrane protein implicated in regulation of membrane protease activity
MITEGIILLVVVAFAFGWVITKFRQRRNRKIDKERAEYLKGEKIN